MTGSRERIGSGEGSRKCWRVAAADESWLRLGWRRIKSCIGRTTDCTTCGLSVTLVASARDADRIFGGRVLFANDTENDQRGGEQRDKGNELAALGFEKIEKSRGFMAGLWVNGWDARWEHW